jgi:hypothetical protein
VILSLLVALVMGLQVLLHGGIGVASADKKTIAELQFTNKDVTVRVPYADATGMIQALAE